MEYGRSMRAEQAIIRLLLVLVLAVSVAGSAGSAGSVLAQGAAPNARLEVRQLAERHAAAGGAMQTQLALRLYRDSGLTEQAIATTYEEAFLKARRTTSAPSFEPSLWKQISDHGVVVGLFVFLVFALGIALSGLVVGGFGRLLKGLVDRAHGWFAGTPLLRRSALRRYRNQLGAEMRVLALSFRPHKPMDMEQVYVVPRVYDDDGEGTPLAALRRFRRLTILGSPGAGKSLLLRHLALEYADGGPTPLADVVALVELRSLAKQSSDAAGESVEEYIAGEFARLGFPKARSLLRRKLDAGRVLILFDALDEVPTEQRSQVAELVRQFLQGYPDVPAVVTCRDAIYAGEMSEVTSATVRVRDFNDGAIARYLSNWASEMPEGRSPAQLLASLRDHPSVAAVTRNPLMLTILVRLYCDVPGYVLPTSRTKFYTDAADVLLAQWHREHNSFEPMHKRMALKSLAAAAQGGEITDSGDLRSMPVQDALRVVRSVLPDLAVEAELAPSLLDEVVNRSGILLSIDGGEAYQFSHQTWQEFFAADYHRSRHEELVEAFDADPTTWREVVKFWCGLAEDATAMVEHVSSSDSDLALECVVDAARISDAFAEELLRQALDGLAAGNALERVERAAGAAAAGPSARGKAVLSGVTRRFAESSEPKAMASLARCLAYSCTPDAVDALAPRYGDSRAVGEALVLLGDLAVERLRDIAQQDVRALDDLLAVGSTRAATAIAELVASEVEAVAQPAAWRLSAVLMRRDLARHLTREPVVPPDDPDDAEYFWVADGGSFRYQPPMRTLIARVARLIATTPSEGLPDRVIPVHPSIGAPLCAVLCERLQDAAGKPVTNELLAAANECLGRKTVVAAEGGFKATYPKDVVRRPPGRLLVPSTLADALDATPPRRGVSRGELLVGVVSELASTKPEESAWSPDGCDAFLQKYVGRTGCPKRTIALLNGMPPAVKLLVLHGLVAKEKPGKDDWCGFSSRPFFGPRWLYQLAQFVAVILLGLAGVGWWQIAQEQLFDQATLLATVGLISLIYATWEVGKALRDGPPFYPRVVAMLVIMAPFGVLVELPDLVRRRTSVRYFGEILPFVPAAPALVVLTTIAVSGWVPAFVPAALWAGAMFVAWLRLRSINDASVSEALRDVSRYLDSHPVMEGDASEVEHLLLHARHSRRTEERVLESGQSES